MMAYLLIMIVCVFGEVAVKASAEAGTRYAHGSQFVNLCTNRPLTAGVGQCATNVAVGVNLFLQDLVITLSVVETGSPALINLAVTTTLSAPNACIADLDTVELQAVDNLETSYCSNMYDYETLCSNRSIFPTFGNESVLTSTNAVAGDFFGGSVALSGDGSTMIVGASGVNNRSGAFYIFERQPVSWAQVNEVMDPAGFQDDNFGRRVAVSHDGTVIAVAGGSNGGTVPIVYIYSYDPSTNQVALLQEIIGASSFGFSIAMSATGKYIAITDASSTPNVFVYERQDSSCALGTTWVLQQMFATEPAAPFASAHVAISPDGTVVAVGIDLIAADNTGVTYLYTRSRTDVWSFSQTVVSSDGVASDQFGWSVALSNNGQYLLVGSPNYPGNGKVYEFVRRGQIWLEENTFVPSGTDNYFGVSIAISGDGTEALIGSNDGVAGEAYIALRSPDNQWKMPFVFTGHAAGALFGADVALSLDGAFAAVGAPDIGGGTGSVSMFSPVGSFISSDAIITGSLCVYSQTTVNGDLFVTGSIITNEAVITGGVVPCTPSDKRIKKAIQPLQFEYAWQQLKKLKPVTFTWKNPHQHKNDGENPAGFIAQEVREVYPHWIREVQLTGDDALCIPEGERALHIAISPEILAYLIAVIKHLHHEDIEQQKMLREILAH